jgi:carbamoyltransferase
MKILGINCSAHDAGVSYMKDGKIICVLEEEKLRGIKSVDLQWVPPTMCLEFLLKEYKLALSDFDCIVFPKSISQSYLSNFDSERSFFYSHHKCHVMGSYLTSGFSGKCISLSHDGKGETSRGRIYLCEDGKYEEIHSQDIATTSSLAGIWGMSTLTLGWRMLKDEGKVVGLAAHGKFNQQIYDWLKECVYYDGKLNFKPAGWESRFWYIFSREKEAGKFYDKEYREDFSFTLEFLSEEIVKSFLVDLHRRYPDYKKLCLSGGLFANVKLNQMINDLPYFDEIFIHPAMGDSGLALGAALCRSLEVGDVSLPIKLRDVYFGQRFSKEEWDESLGEKYQIEKFSPEYAASLINEGKVLGVFLGRTEYGPRSLGNRSIVVKPTDRETHQNLNTKLKRTEIMPFAPSVLEEHSEEVFKIKKSSYTAEFMTMCYDVSDSWADKIPAVIQVLDGSSRPHVVRREVNQIYYDIIDEYKKISGIPVVLNTSFNAHGEPINNYPHQVLKHLNDEIVDFIITEDYIISKR